MPDRLRDDPEGQVRGERGKLGELHGIEARDEPDLKDQ